ncbi:TPA: hypothetical protein EYP83_02345 [Candidatus Geothermarchaeota archaeon]|nr:hypothetical protein [Candidatus Geothermarchaeota archaeon]HIQ13878.1 hypothetical protein [Thermoprotei archaeon]
MNGESDVYSRIKSLSKMVLEGSLDPLDIDISMFIDLLSKVDVDRLPIELFMEDVEALNGLSQILKYQKEAIIRYLEGLKLDELIVKTAILSLDIDGLSEIVRRIYRPSADISTIDNDFIVKSLLYFKNIRRLKREFTDRLVEIDSIDIPIEEDIRKHMDILYKRLLETSKDEWVNYKDILLDKPILNSYLISLLASEGYLIIRVDRISGEVYVKPLSKKVNIVNPVSIPIVVDIYGYGEED